MRKMNLALAAFSVVLVLFSCKKDETKPAVTETKVLLVNGATTGNYFLYSFANGAQVANADSATNKWDFAMRFERIIVNSGVSGPGGASVQIVDGVFDNYNTAPDAGYAYDSTTVQTAVKGSQWYNYDAATRTFAPKAGKVFIFKTNTGNYAKMEILSADPTDDNGNAVVPPTRPTKIKYTIRQAIQTDGTKNFK